MLISIIVATYNRAEQLRAALQSLLHLHTLASFDYEVVVVDNASTDDTNSVVQSIAEDSPVPIRIVAETMPGVAFARNRGITESSGDWVAFFDDDQIADPDWLKELFSLAELVSARCVGGRVDLNLPQNELVRLSQVCRAILGETFHGSQPIKLGRKELPGTGNVLLHRSIFKSVGIFDEATIFGGEDAGLFRAVRKAGYDIWYAPQAVVLHAVPTYRLGIDYFMWASLRHGVAYAFLDCKMYGNLKIIGLGLARTAQALCLNLPAYLFYALSNNKIDFLGRRCLLGRAVGYVREVVYLLAPQVFSQKRFFDKVSFRAERKGFCSVLPVPPPLSEKQ